MFDNSPGSADHPLKRWGRRHPRLALWAVGGVVGLLVLAALLSAHGPGVPMITPGKKPLPLAQTALEEFAGAIQAPRLFDQTRAATRQAEAKG